MNRLTSFRHAYLIIATFILFTGCVEPPPFKGFTEGIVVCKATSNNFGFFEIHDTNHEESFMVMYKHEDCTDCKLEAKKFFKVKTIKGVHIAQDIKNTLASGDEMKTVAATSIFNYHCFYKDFSVKEIHRRGHANTRVAEPPNANGEYSVKINETNYRGDYRIKAIVNAILDESLRVNEVEGSDVYYLENDGLLIDVDLCHYHAERKVDCIPVGDKRN